MGLRLPCHVTVGICKYENVRKILGHKRCKDTGYIKQCVIDELVIFTLRPILFG